MNDANTPLEPACPRCSSSDLFDADAIDGHVGHRIKLRVHANPRALLFKGTQFAKLRARTCSRCGHVELFLSPEDARRLREAWQKDPRYR